MAHMERSDFGKFLSSIRLSVHEAFARPHGAAASLTGNSTQGPKELLSYLDAEVTAKSKNGFDVRLIKFGVAYGYFSAQLKTQNLFMPVVTTFNADGYAWLLASIYADDRIPELWFARLAFDALTDLNSFSEGRAIPARAVLHPNALQARQGEQVHWANRCQLPAVTGDVNRPAKVQLALTIFGLIDTMPSQKVDIEGAIDKALLNKTVLPRKELLYLFDAAAAQLIMQLNGGGHDDTHKQIVYDRIAVLDPLLRMEFVQVAMTVLPTQSDGKKHMQQVFEAKSSLLQTSPLHPSEILKVLNAFKIEKKPSGWVAVKSQEQKIWANNGAADAALNQISPSAQPFLDVYSQFVVASAIYLQYSSTILSLGNAARTNISPSFTFHQDMNFFLRRNFAIAESSSKIFSFILSGIALAEASQTISNKTTFQNTDLFDMMKSLNGMIGSTAAFSPANNPNGAITNAGRIARFTGVLTIAFCLVDSHLAMQKNRHAQNFEQVFANIASASANVLSATSVLLGMTRAVPHPVAVVAGLLGIGLQLIVGWWEKSVKIDELKGILGNTYFSEKSLADRVKRVDKILAELMKDKNQNMILTDLPNTLLTAEGKDDLPRQIAAVLGAANVFQFDIKIGNIFLLEITTGRKVPLEEGKTYKALNLQRSLLPVGSVLELYDATQEQRNFQKLPIDEQRRRPTSLMTIPKLSNAARAVLRTEQLITIDVLAEIARPDVFEAVLTFPVPAWPHLFGAKPAGEVPPAQVIVRVPATLNAKADPSP
jgi:hypothetical protein